ncbi:TCR/Tet family MFS transporter [Sphingobacterium paludis]|uniref:DHA1 family tetracycline resistance protein-like MFS transporter n=1 Tax=Sphingobacterium paludis TaxID=1476465 RepID=A0A4R7D6P0_9SPHI|nr:TCR/Tet family MFS transporter [Sphingobacterium paludis]TDS16042.1 DHA1 family tetracycline resistance protein-like MFS transporter [Sphingobacterium paludis]
MLVTKKSGLFFIFLTVVIDTIGLGIIIPVLPSLIKELIHGTLSDASRYGGWLMFAYAFTQFLFASVLGNLSDCYGRRPVLLFSLLGFCANYVLMGFAPSIAWLFLGRLVAGVTGASHTVAAAYIADISSPQNKAQNFGLLGAAFGLGFIIGPVIGGLLGQYGARIPFFAAGGLSLLNFIYGYFVVPESLKEENRRSFSWRNANPVGAFRHMAKYPQIYALVACIFLVNIAAHAVQSTWSYYTMEKFQWDEKMVGISLGFIGTLLTIVQAGLLRIAIPKLGLPRSILIGLLLHSISLPLIGLANSTFMLYAVSILYVCGGIGGPALQSMISNLTPTNEQGQIQGGIASLISLTAIFGPLLMSNLFAVFTTEKAAFYFPGAPFMAGGLMTLTALFTAYIYFRNVKASK